MPDQKITQLSSDTPTLDDYLTTVNDPSGTPDNKRVTVAAVLALAYPVGSIYISVNSTNPGTSLGFGTWSAFGAGRVPVGFDSGQTEFDTDEETGGAKTVTLTGAQSGTSAHTHNITDPGHTHPLEELNIQDTGSGAIVAFEGASTNFATNSATTGITIDNSSEASAAEAHNNLQPYITVRMWKRTA